MLYQHLFKHQKRPRWSGYLLIYLGLLNQYIIWKIEVMSQYDCIDWANVINRSLLIFMLTADHLDVSVYPNYSCYHGILVKNADIVWVLCYEHKPAHR